MHSRSKDSGPGNDSDENTRHRKEDQEHDGKDFKQARLRTFPTSNDPRRVV
jgi:hypothetical protein